MQCSPVHLESGAGELGQAASGLPQHAAAGGGVGLGELPGGDLHQHDTAVSVTSPQSSEAGDTHHLRRLGLVGLPVAGGGEAGGPAAGPRPALRGRGAGARPRGRHGAAAGHGQAGRGYISTSLARACHLSGYL